MADRERLDLLELDLLELDLVELDLVELDLDDSVCAASGRQEPIHLAWPARAGQVPRAGQLPRATQVASGVSVGAWKRFHPQYRKVGSLAGDEKYFTPPKQVFISALIRVIQGQLCRLKVLGQLPCGRAHLEPGPKVQIHRQSV